MQKMSPDVARGEGRAACGKWQLVVNSVEYLPHCELRGTRNMKTPNWRSKLRKIVKSQPHMTSSCVCVYVCMCLQVCVCASK